MIWRFRPRNRTPTNSSGTTSSKRCKDRPYNEAKRSTATKRVSLPPWAACQRQHTGQLITFDQMLNHEHELAPRLDES